MLCWCIPSNVHVKFSNFMSIHAWSRNLDSTSPIEVVIAKIIGKLLYHILFERGIVECHIEMSRQNTTLCSILWNQIEIIFHIIILVLNNLVIDAASWRRILKVTILILYKESLCNSLIDNDKCEIGLLFSFVVGFINCFSELSDLLLKHLASHSITNTISVNDEMLWLRVMSLLKAL